MNIELSKRYCSHELGTLVKQLQNNAQLSKTTKIEKIQRDQKVHHSCAQIYGKKYKQKKLFNNKTKQGQFFTKNPPQVPYLFIPKYKNDTHIMPDRVFQKGKSGKRFVIKMKDSSIYSFKDQQPQRYNKVIQKSLKDKIISGRKMQELNRILDTNDGRQKANHNKWHLKNRKIFNPTSSVSQFFQSQEPMLSPKDSQTVQIKKTTLSKTHAINKWRPVSTKTQFFKSATSTPFSQTQAFSYR